LQLQAANGAVDEGGVNLSATGSLRQAEACAGPDWSSVWLQQQQQQQQQCQGPCCLPCVMSLQAACCW
jgi:hypothetical protein